MTAGALVVGLAASFFYPRYKAWDNSPSFGKALCDCAEITRNTAAGMLTAQMYGVAVGAVLGIIVALVLVARSRRTAKPPA